MPPQSPCERRATGRIDSPRYREYTTVAMVRFRRPRQIRTNIRSTGLTKAVIGMFVCLCLACSACIPQRQITIQPTNVGPQIYQFDSHGDFHQVATAPIASFSGHFKIPPSQLNPSPTDPAVIDPADGNVILDHDPTLVYWLASDDQVLVSWDHYILTLPCQGSSDFGYDLCTDQMLLAQPGPSGARASNPSQCPTDILLDSPNSAQAFDLAINTGFLILLGLGDGAPDGAPPLQAWATLCPNFDCAQGVTRVDMPWPWWAGCRSPSVNPSFQSQSFKPIDGGSYQLWASGQRELGPHDPPDKLGAQVNLHLIKKGEWKPDENRLPFIETCGPRNPNGPSMPPCDPTESRWNFDPSAAMKEAFSASLRVKEIRVFDQPGDPSQSVAFCWAEAAGTGNTRSTSDCDDQSVACKKANGNATPGTPFMTAGTTTLPSPWIIGFSDDPSSNCTIPALSKIWVEFTLEVR